MDDWFDEVFEEAWNKQTTRYEKFLEEYGQGETNHAPTWTIKDPATGAPKKCRICDCEDDWVFEGTAFVCEHGIIYGSGMALRVLDSIGVQKLLEEPKQTGRFRQQRVGVYEA